VCRRIYTNITDCNFVRVVLRLHRCDLRAARDGAKSCQQFSGRKSFRQVIVRPDFESDDAVGFVSQRCEHQNRHNRELPNLFENLKTVSFRQHYVENYGLEIVVFDLFQALRSGVRRFYFKTEGREIIFGGRAKL
jgi:hypothetical protein